MEFLKVHLGDALYAQVAEALKDKGLKLADLSGGEYVGKGKHDALGEQMKTLQADMVARDKQLDELKKVDAAGLQAEIVRLQGENKTAKEAADQQFAGLKLDTAVHSYASGHRFTSELARNAFVSELKGAGLKLSDEGKLLGADDVIKGIREKNPGAFEAEKPGGPGFAGTQPPGQGGGGGDANNQMNSLIRGMRGA